MVQKVGDNDAYPHTINKDFFINDCKAITSAFFSENFVKVIQSIKASEDTSGETPSKLKVVVEVSFDDSTANFLNIVHGGSIAILFENITNALLYHFTKKCYFTISSTITYKSTIFLNTTYQMVIDIDKLLFKTVFIEGTITEIITTPSLYPYSSLGNIAIPSAGVSLIKELP